VFDENARFGGRFLSGVFRAELSDAPRSLQLSSVPS